MNTDLVFVHESGYSDFRRSLIRATDNFAASNTEPTLISQQAKERTDNIFLEGVDGFGSFGYTIANIPKTAKSARVRRPDGVAHGSRLYPEESFGPIFGVVEVKSAEEATDRINEMDYGLSVAVFTENLRTGLRVARQIESG